MKKILYIVDFSLRQYNSVRDIHYNLLHHEEMESYNHVLVQCDGHLSYPMSADIIDGYKFYYTTDVSIKTILSDRKYNFFHKIELISKRLIYRIMHQHPRRIWNKFDKNQNTRYFKKVLCIEKPDLVIYFTYSPNKEFNELCTNLHIPFISMLYDTVIERPRVWIVDRLAEESSIQNAVAYFVPGFFYDGYLKHYNNPKIIPYNLPLLIDKYDVVHAYQSSRVNYDFSYFGQMQPFRNGDRIKDIFRELNCTLDVFSTSPKENDGAFIHHPAVTHKELYDIIVGSKYLVAIDNSAPYSDYLPSKAYLYVSFTKPVIAFGDNEDSALIRFFKDYPWFYYHNINNPSLEGLQSFIDRYQNNESKFHENIYSNYTQFSPHIALKPIVSLVKKTLEE